MIRKAQNKLPLWLALKHGIIDMIMRDYKNHKPASQITFIDYLAAAGFILTIILLIIISTL
jgi:fumarate reductase subunit D